MAVRSLAAPSESRSVDVAAPQVHETAYIHPFSQVVGDVRIGANVLVAPGASIRASAGAPFWVGEGACIQDGVVIHGLPQGRVLGDDQQPYSVWIGPGASITHKVLIQGPAYIGEGCFVGFRSTLFNARLGKGCIVMMHALIQDVEVPPGKYVPSGTVLTQQAQADQLPDVQAVDRVFAEEVMGVNEALRSGYVGAEDEAYPVPSHEQRGRSPVKQSNERNGLSTMQSQRLTPEIVQQVRQLLAQGYLLGTEHADSRRFRSGVWQTCSPIQKTREADALAALDACLAEHGGEYVRLFGIDPVAKQRISPVTIQRPDGKPVHLASTAAVPSASTAASPSSSAPATGGLSAEVVQQVRQYLRQGYRIGTEHADQRRYRSNVWQTCSPIESNRESDVLAAIENCMAEHAGEYVRLFGIDPQAKRRVAPVTIQRPDDKPVSAGGTRQPMAAASSASTASTAAPRGTLSGDTVQKIRQWLAQGYRIGAEHADQRRYRSNVWQTCTPMQSNRESEVFAAVEACMAEHPGEYVRVFGIDPVAKKRITPVTVQRPGDQPSASSSTAAPAPASSSAAAAPAPNYQRNGSSGQSVSSDLAQQVNQLVNQGYRLGLEHADTRRYRSGTWQNGGALEGSRASDILSALESRLREHRGEYVRLIGIDPRAKRRVLETTIQRP